MNLKVMVGDNISYRIGQGNGHYKIYNKKKESDLNIVGNLTRVELSLEFEDFPIADIKDFDIDIRYLPDVYLNQYVVSLSDTVTKDKTLNVVLFAVQHGFPMKDLSRAYKNKIKGLLEGGSRVRFAKIHILEAFKKCIFAYLIGSKQYFR